MLDYIMEFLANGCHQTNPDKSGFAVHVLNSDNCPMGTRGVKVFIPETEIEAYKSQREKKKNRAYLISFIGSNDVVIVFGKQIQKESQNILPYGQMVTLRA